MLPFDLEDWLTENADRVLGTPEPWEPVDQLLYEIWLFEGEVRNGGVSQYFCNFPERWSTLLILTGQLLPEFSPVARALNEVVSGAADPYKAVLSEDERLETVYETHQVATVKALKKILDHT